MKRRYTSEEMNDIANRIENFMIVREFHGKVTTDLRGFIEVTCNRDIRYLILARFKDEITLFSVYLRDNSSDYEITFRMA